MMIKWRDAFVGRAVPLHADSIHEERRTRSDASYLCRQMRTERAQEILHFRRIFK